MKKALLLVAIASIGISTITHAQRRIEYNPAVFKRGAIFGANSLRLPQESAHVEIGDTNTTKGLLLHPTDTSKIAGTKKNGLLIYQIKGTDTAHYFWNGKRWKKIGT